MNRIYSCILLTATMFASIGCHNIEIDIDVPAGGNDNEVRFGLSLPYLTRTVYGDRDGNAYPIYWVDGDKVQVYSPHAANGRQTAEYEVSVESTEQNYASSLTPTADFGVQWGTGYSSTVGGSSVEGLHDFYSIYPSGKNYQFLDEGKTIKNLKVNFSDEFQVTGSGNAVVVTPKAADCLMVAKSIGVSKGDVVDLKYTPIATAIMFTLRGPSNSGPVKQVIRSIKLIADTEIAGVCNVELCTDSTSPNNGKYVFKDWVDNNITNTITAQIYDKSTGGFFEMGQEQSIRLAMFIAPLDRPDISKWKIEVVTETNTFTKTLKLNNSDPNSKPVLMPGMVHELPALPYLDGEPEEWETTDWMEHIPRNVYLSEISIPGTWNSLNDDFQNQVSIDQQYSTGIRAFHLDTRWRSTSSTNILGAYLGSINGLSVAATADSKNHNTTGKKVVSSKGDTFESYLDEIVDNLSADEYMVVFCTFAQDSYDHTGDNGKWYGEISAICGKEKYNDIIYDAKQLSPSTVLGEVLNRIIVVINMPDEITQNSDLPVNSKCLYTYLPSNLQAAHFDGTDDNKDLLWLSKESVSSTGITMFNSQAQVSSSQTNPISHRERGYAPTLTQRSTIINKILDWSRSNYATVNYKHDQWIYLGLGGYQVSSASSGEVSGSYSTIENTLNTLIYDRVSAMGNGVPYYPVGIVFMNNKRGTNYEGKTYGYADVVKEILMLNNRYRLQFDPDKPSNYDPNAKSRSDYASAMNNGGNAISLD